MKKLLVKDVYDELGTMSISVREDVPLIEVVKRFARGKGLHGIFLVDSRRRFNGVITRRDLLNWARSHSPIETGANQFSRRELMRMGFAAKARDLAQGDRGSLGVLTSNTLEEALKQMLDYDVEHIPVLERDGTIVGDLTLPEALSGIIEAAKIDSE